MISKLIGVLMVEFRSPRTMILRSRALGNLLSRKGSVEAAGVKAILLQWVGARAAHIFCLPTGATVKT